MPTDVVANDLVTLLATHADAVAAALAAATKALANTLDDLKEEGPYDETFALRFVLSNMKEGPNVTADNLIKTIKWRRENASWLTATKNEDFNAIERFVAAGYHGATHEGNPLYIVRAGISNAVALMDACKEEDVVRWMLWKREQGFQTCDRLTRETGTMHRMLVVNDLNHVSLVSGQDPRFRAVLAKVSKMSEVYYPQLLGRSVLINVPRLFSALFSAFKLILSKKMLAKIAICPGRTLTEDISRCPFASKVVNLDTLPTFLGGRCRCKPGCISEVPNDQTENVCRVGGDGMSLCKVAARDKHDVYLEVDAGDKVGYSLQVEERGVEISVVLKDEDGGELTLVQPRKHKAEDGLHEGVVACPTKGTLVLHFDNTYSYFREKSIRYSASVLSVTGNADDDADAEG